jgi:hypothetical protein
MKSHRCSLISLRPNESTNDPPCSESSANRESEGGLRIAWVGRPHRAKAGPITLGVDVGRAHLQRKIPKRG